MGIGPHIFILRHKYYLNWVDQSLTGIGHLQKMVFFQIKLQLTPPPLFYHAWGISKYPAVI